jgi:large subunit ribosomal protein L29
MSQEEREERLQELRTELTKIKTMVKAGGSIENPGRSKSLKKTIARILTIMNEEVA